MIFVYFDLCRVSYDGTNLRRIGFATYAPQFGRVTSQTFTIAREHETDNMAPKDVPLFLWFASALSKRIPCGPANCEEVQCSGMVFKTTYTLRLADDERALRVVCDLRTDYGGWTVFQKRVAGSLSFVQSWNAYKDGFGNDFEFWLGNEYIHRLTRGRKMLMRIEIRNEQSGEARHAYYDNFEVGDEKSGYKLRLGSYLTEYSTAGDALRYVTLVVTDCRLHPCVQYNTRRGKTIQ